MERVPKSWIQAPNPAYPKAKTHPTKPQYCGVFWYGKHNPVKWVG